MLVLCSIGLLGCAVLYIGPIEGRIQVSKKQGVTNPGVKVLWEGDRRTNCILQVTPEYETKDLRIVLDNEREIPIPWEAAVSATLLRISARRIELRYSPDSPLIVHYRLFVQD